MLIPLTLCPVVAVVAVRPAGGLRFLVDRRGDGSVFDGEVVTVAAENSLPQHQSTAFRGGQDGDVVADRGDHASDAEQLVLLAWVSGREGRGITGTRTAALSPSPGAGRGTVACSWSGWPGTRLPCC